MNVAALFDLDGVLIDTEEQYSVFWTSVGRDYFPEMEDFAKRLKGQTLHHIYDTFFSDSEDKRIEIKKRLERFEQTMQYPWMAGAKEFVSTLREYGISSAVVTSSNLDKMRHLYAARPEFSSLFDFVFTSEDSARSKPAPDCYLYAMKELGTSADKCVVFEDSLNGLRAGRDSGAKVVGLATTNSSEVIASFCDEVIADFRDYDATRLLELVRKEK